MATASITVDMDRKCAECGKPGAAESGICLACAAKVVTGERMRSPDGQAAQARFESGTAARARREQGAARDGVTLKLDVTMRRGPLLEAVKLALAVAPKRAVLPVLSMIRLQVTAVGRLLIQATDLEQTLTISLEGCGSTPETPGECLVSPRALAVVLAGGPDEVRLQRRQSGFGVDRLYVNGLEAAGGNGWLALVDAAEWPREAEPGADAASAHVEAKALRRALGLVSAARSQDESRQILNGTYLEIRAGEVIAMATDGRRAARAAVTTETGRSAAAGVVFPPRTGDLLHKVAEGDLVLTIWPEGIRVESTDADSGRVLRLTAKTFAGLYPNVEQVFPLREVATRVRRVQAEELREAAALVVELARCSGEELHADLVIQRCSPGSMVVEAAGGYQAEWWRHVSADAVAGALAGREEDVIGIEDRTVLNAGFLADALAPLTGPCEVWFHGRNTPVMVESVGYAHAIMPMRQDGDQVVTVQKPASGPADGGPADVVALQAAGTAAPAPASNEEAWEAEKKMTDPKAPRKRTRKGAKA